MNCNNGVDNLYGFSTADYEVFKTSYGQLSHAISRNDYCEATLFTKIRDGISKKNFSRLLTEKLGLSASEISYLCRKLSAFQQISDRNIWETIGYTGVQKILWLPQEQAQKLLSMLRNEKNLTVESFTSLYQNYVSLFGTKLVKEERMERAEIRESKAITVRPEQLAEIVSSSIQKVMHGKGSRKSRKNDWKHEGRRPEGRKRGQRQQRETLPETSMFGNESRIFSNENAFQPMSV
jgi:hypothetical protein